MRSKLNWPPVGPIFFTVMLTLGLSAAAAHAGEVIHGVTFGGPSRVCDTDLSTTAQIVFSEDEREFLFNLILQFMGSGSPLDATVTLDRLMYPVEWFSGPKLNLRIWFHEDARPEQDAYVLIESAELNVRYIVKDRDRRRRLRDWIRARVMHFEQEKLAILGPRPAPPRELDGAIL